MNETVQRVLVASLRRAERHLAIAEQKAEWAAGEVQVAADDVQVWAAEVEAIRANLPVASVEAGEVR